MSETPRIAVVMPAYQAAEHLAGVVDRLRRSIDAELVAVHIVDDGSTDATARVASGLAAADGRIRIHQRPQNGGYGAAVRDGLRFAAADDVEIVACVHADGQYAPEELPRLAEELQRRELDLLQGSRMASGTALSGGMPLYKFVSNRALTTLGNVVFGLGMSDYYSGYLLYSRRALEQVPFERLSDSFDFDLEVIASAHALGLRVGEAPVPTHYGDEVSHLRPIRYGLRVLRVFWRYQWGHYGARPNDPKRAA